MFLSTKLDFEEAVLRWRHFWNGELYRRPVVLTSTPRADAGSAPQYKKSYRNACDGLWEEELELINRWLDAAAFPGDMIPMFTPDLGPDQWAAFFGGELKFSGNSSHTNWVDPIVDDWESFLPLRFDPSNETFRKMTAYAEFLAERGEGRFLVSHIDAHSNADALSALRGPERFMMDFYDFPELLDRAMKDIRASYIPVHEAVASAGRMGERGHGHNGIWHPEGFQIVQSDVICMLSPEHFRRYVLPALREEIYYHKNIYFHLDGPGALKHLDEILAIPGYWILQFVPGAGERPNWQWVEVLEKAQNAGKAVHVFGEGLGMDQIKNINSSLDPARVVYTPSLESESEVRRLCRWLENNT